MLLTLSVVSLFVDSKIKPVRPITSYSATEGQSFRFSLKTVSRSTLPRETKNIYTGAPIPLSARFELGLNNENLYFGSPVCKKKRGGGMTSATAIE